jgi:hypothetical protein
MRYVLAVAVVSLLVAAAPTHAFAQSGPRPPPAVTQVTTSHGVSAPRPPSGGSTGGTGGTGSTLPGGRAGATSSNGGHSVSAGVGGAAGASGGTSEAGMRQTGTPSGSPPAPQRPDAQSPGSGGGATPVPAPAPAPAPSNNTFGEGAGGGTGASSGSPPAPQPPGNQGPSSSLGTQPLASPRMGASRPDASPDKLPVGADTRPPRGAEVEQSYFSALTASSAQLPDGSYAEIWSLSSTSTECRLIRMEATDFDAYLALRYGTPTGDLIAEDDDGGGGTTAVIRARFPQSGTYFIIATSSGRGTQTGQYRLSISPC